MWNEGASKKFDEIIDKSNPLSGLKISFLYEKTKKTYGLLSSVKYTGIITLGISGAQNFMNWSITQESYSIRVL